MGVLERNELALRAAGPSSRAKLLADRAELLARLGRFDEAQHCLQEGRGALAAAGADPGHALHLDLAQAILLYFRHRYDDAAERLRELGTRVDAQARAELAGAPDAVLAALRLRQDRVEEAFALAQSVLARPVAPATRLRARIVEAAALGKAGNWPAARTAYDAALADARATGDDIAETALSIRAAVAQASDVLAMTADGDVPAALIRAAITTVRETLNLLRDRQSSMDRIMLNLLHGQLLLADEQRETGRAVLETAVTQAEAAGLARPETACALAALARQQAELGRLSQADALIKQADAKLERADSEIERAIVAVHRARVLECRGDATGARDARQDAWSRTAELRRRQQHWRQMLQPARHVSTPTLEGRA